MVDVRDGDRSDGHNESGNLNSNIHTGEEEIDDGRYEYGCFSAVRKSFSPVRFQESDLVEGFEAASPKEKINTNVKITIDAEKSITNTPVNELVDEPHTAGKEDIP